MIQKKHLTVAVLGAQDTILLTPEILEHAREIGRQLALHGVTVATASVAGFGMWAALGAYEEGGLVIGFSPASSEVEHRQHFRQPLDYLHTVVFTGFGYLGRDIVMARSVDAVIIGLSDMDTAHELVSSVYANKPVFVIRNNYSDEQIQEMVGDVFSHAQIIESVEHLADHLDIVLDSKK
jgi:predicted Rossmann-fold nucleotide-binding protein